MWLVFYTPVLAFILFLGFYHIKVWMARIHFCFLEIKEYLLCHMMQVIVMRHLDSFVRMYYQRRKCYLYDGN